MQEQINKMEKIQIRQGVLLSEIHTALKGNNLGTSGLVNDIKENKEQGEKNKVQGFKNQKAITNIKSNSMVFGSAAGGSLMVIWEGIKHFFIGGNH